MTEDDRRLWVHVRDNIDRDQPRPRGKLLDRSIYVHHVPRLMLLCRLFGHRPVVDGSKLTGDRTPARWVTCDRCDTRPYPQGRLDPDVFRRGDPYRGDFSGVPTSKMTGPHGWQAPGPFPPDPTGDLSFQIVIGGRDGGTSASLGIGCSGAEDAVGGHIAVTGLGGLYGGCERHGAWLQRRLIPGDYDDRECTVRLIAGRLSWTLWGRAGHRSTSDPWWMHGSLRINPLDVAFGPKIYTYDDVGDPKIVTVRMPHGDDHDVTLQLQRQHRGRERGRRRFQHWIVAWDVVSGGIPVKRPSSSGVYGSAVKVSAAGAETGGWANEAAAAIAAQLAADRSRYGYRPVALA